MDIQPFQYHVHDRRFDPDRGSVAHDTRSGLAAGGNRSEPLRRADKRCRETGKSETHPFLRQGKLFLPFHRQGNHHVQKRNQADGRDDDRHKPRR